VLVTDSLDEVGDSVTYHKGGLLFIYVENL